MQRIFSHRLFTPAFLGALAIAVLLTYSNTFTGAFQFDDIPSIKENSFIHDIGNFWTILKVRRGLTLATFALNYAFGGMNTIGYHAVNVLIHVINAFLAYFVIYYALTYSGSDEARSKRLSALTVLLFALHPIQTQSVAYISQRMETLASLFYLLAVLLLVKGARAGSSGKRAALYAGVAASYALGFHSKEIAITLPAAVFLYDLYFISGLSFKKTLSRWPLYLVLAGMLVFFGIYTVKGLGGFGDVSKESSVNVVSEPQKAALKAVAPSIDVPVQKEKPKAGLTAGFTVQGLSKKDYLLTQFNVLVYYVALMAAPAYQTLDYDFPVSRGLFETPKVNEGTLLVMPIPPPFLSLLILLSFIAAAAYLFFRSRKTGGLTGRLISFSVFWYFIILSPTSSFIPIIDVIYEHRVYLASLGFFAIFVSIVELLAQKAFPASSDARQ